MKQGETTIMKMIFAVALLVFLSTDALGQAPTPTPTPVPAPTPELINPNDAVHFDLSAAFQLVNNSANVNGSDSVQATVITLRVPVTDRFSGFAKVIALPKSTATVNLGGIEYRRNLADFLKSPSLKIDPSKYAVF